MRLVPDWRRIHKMWSVWASLVITILSIAEASLQAHGSQLMEPKTFAIVMLVLGVAVPILRAIKQPEKDK